MTNKLSIASTKKKVRELAEGYNSMGATEMMVPPSTIIEILNEFDACENELSRFRDSVRVITSTKDISEGITLRYSEETIEEAIRESLLAGIIRAMWDSKIILVTRDVGKDPFGVKFSAKVTVLKDEDADTEE